MACPAGRFHASQRAVPSARPATLPLLPPLVRFYRLAFLALLQPFEDSPVAVQRLLPHSRIRRSSPLRPPPSERSNRRVQHGGYLCFVKDVVGGVGHAGILPARQHPKQPCCQVW